MLFAYMDESGNSGEKSDPRQPIHLLGCLIVDASAVNEFEADLDDIAMEFFPETWQKTEFKAQEIYSGSGPFKKLTVERRIELAEKILNKTNEHALGFGYSGVDKRKFYGSDHPHRVAFGLMMEGVQPFCAQRNELGLIIADEYNEISKTLQKDFTQIKRTGTFWGYRQVKADNIVDTIHLVRSAENRLVQACDLATYFMLAQIKLEEGKLTEWLELNEPRPAYSQWLEDGMKRADKATLKLARIASQPTRFRAKVFPNG